MTSLPSMPVQLPTQVNDLLASLLEVDGLLAVAVDWFQRQDWPASDAALVDRSIWTIRSIGRAAEIAVGRGFIVHRTLCRARWGKRSPDLSRDDDEHFAGRLAIARAGLDELEAHIDFADPPLVSPSAPVLLPLPLAGDATSRGPSAQRPSPPGRPRDAEILLRVLESHVRQVDGAIDSMGQHLEKFDAGHGEEGAGLHDLLSQLAHLVGVARDISRDAVSTQKALAFALAMRWGGARGSSRRKK